MGCSSSAAADKEVKKEAPPLGYQYTHSGFTYTFSPEGKESFHQQYRLGARLGKGKFAQVLLGTKVRTNQKFAVKIVDMRRKEAPDDPAPLWKKKIVLHEVHMLRKVVGNTSCVQIHDALMDDKLCYIIMEKCAVGIYAYLDSAPEVTERTLASILRGMLLGIRHCHSVGLVHRDIKPDNFLVGGDDWQTVKLTDFGLSQVLTANKRHLIGISGTAPFMSPEMLNRNAYGTKTDIWSFGVIAYVFLFGRFPYEPEVQSSKDMENAIRLGFPEPCYEPSARCTEKAAEFQVSRSAISFVRALLNRNAGSRPDSNQSLEFAFMAQAAKKDGGKPPSTLLPSLRVMIYEARRAGAFDLRDIWRDEAGVGDILNALQEQHQGKRTPPSPLPEKTHRDKTRESGGYKEKIPEDAASLPSTDTGGSITLGSTLDSGASGGSRKASKERSTCFDPLTAVWRDNAREGGPLSPSSSRKPDHMHNHMSSPTDSPPCVVAPLPPEGLEIEC